MANSYLTGLGFIGERLFKRVRPIAIAHQDILSTTFSDFDYFYFLSAYGNINGQIDSQKIMRANIMDPSYTIEQLKNKKFKSFVFISTSSVKLKHQTMYSRTKRAAEEILLAYMEKYDLPICIIRPFSITGIGEQPEHLIPTLIESCVTGKLMNFVPEPTHDYIDVDDVVDGIINLSTNGARGIFELGTGISYSNDQIRLLVEKATGKKANINQVNTLRPYDNQNWVSTNFKSRGWGWRPKKTIADSIMEMVNTRLKTLDLEKHPY